MRASIRTLLISLLFAGALLSHGERLRAMPAPARIDFGGSFGLKYNPSRLTIHAGEMVQWQGSFSAHPLISDDKLWPDQGAGTAFTFTFREPGTFHYHCGRHSGMAGIVEVLP